MSDDQAPSDSGPPSLPGKAGSENAAPANNREGTDIHNYIGSRLRRAFDDVASQPVPDRFLELMAQLDKS